MILKEVSPLPSECESCDTIALGYDCGCCDVVRFEWVYESEEERVACRKRVLQKRIDRLERQLSVARDELATLSELKNEEGRED